MVASVQFVGCEKKQFVGELPPGSTVEKTKTDATEPTSSAKTNQQKVSATKAVQNPPPLSFYLAQFLPYNRHWVSADSQHVAYGKLNGYDDKHAYLLINAGTLPVKVPLEKLSDADRKYVAEVARLYKPTEKKYRINDTVAIEYLLQHYPVNSDRKYRDYPPKVKISSAANESKPFELQAVATDEKQSDVSIKIASEKHLDVGNVVTSRDRSKIAIQLVQTSAQAQRDELVTLVIYDATKNKVIHQSDWTRGIVSAISNDGTILVGRTSEFWTSIHKANKHQYKEAFDRKTLDVWKISGADKWKWEKGIRWARYAFPDKIHITDDNRFIIAHGWLIELDTLAIHKPAGSTFDPKKDPRLQLEDELRQRWVWYMFRDQVQLDAPDPLYRDQMTRDGKYLCTLNVPKLVRRKTGFREITVSFRDLSTHETVKTLTLNIPHGGLPGHEFRHATYFDLSPDGKKFAVLFDFDLLIFDLSGKLLRSFAVPRVGKIWWCDNQHIVVQPIEFTERRKYMESGKQTPNLGKILLVDTKSESALIQFTTGSGRIDCEGNYWVANWKNNYCHVMRVDLASSDLLKRGASECSLQPDGCKVR